MFTKKILAAGLIAGLAFVGSAGAAPIQFDPDGANANGGADKGIIVVNSFDWDAGNSLLVGGILVGAIPAGVPYAATLLVQSRLSAFQPGSQAVSEDGGGGTDADDGGSVYEFTYQATIPVTITPIALGGGSAVLTAALAGPGSFDVFFDATADGNASLDNSGCGYGTTFAAPCGPDGSVSILSGTISALVGMSWTLTATIAPSPLDGFDEDPGPGDGNGLPGITTWDVGGSGTAIVDVTTYDSDFFLQDITKLTTDVTFSGANGGAPFAQTNPTTQVVGYTPIDYGTGVNGDTSCGTGVATETCDVHTQNDATMSFNHNENFVPEPGTLALLGMGLGFIGWRARRPS